jgi:hypothetical protein
MDEHKQEQATQSKPVDFRNLIQEAVREFVSMEQSKSEPAYKAELEDERRRRETLERRMNELVEENRRSRQIAEEAERSSTIRGELQRLGVQKLDLAFRAVKDDIQRTEDGRLVAKTSNGDLNVKDYLTHFVTENPELLPARIPGGSGASTSSKAAAPMPAGSFDLDKIRPGMPKEELERARQEIARIAQQINSNR